ncbi:MAG TPA: HIT domain-containing protein [Ktedonobacterales bacterium]
MSERPEELEPPGPIAGCPFCALGDLETPLTETRSFCVVGDHAPLVSGHILIIPKAHYACYGAVPTRLDDELLTLKETIRRFLSEVYHQPTFFEHGVFRQTVAHAHLHAIPLGEVSLRLEDMATGSGGKPLRGQNDLRSWYASHGHYFTLETPGDPEHGVAPQAAVFPPEMGVYGRALNTVRQLANTQETWTPQSLRYETRIPKMRALAQAWQAWSAQGE